MADLSPNLSIYSKAPSSAPPFANMSIGDLVNTARSLQQFGTERAMSDALTSMDPNTPGGPDYSAAVSRLLNDPRSRMLTPGLLQGMTSAAQSQLQLNQSRSDAATKLIGSLITKPGGATTDDVNHMTAVAASLGIPPDILAPIIGVDPKKDPQGFQTHLARIWNYATGNQPLPTVSSQLSTGETVNLSGGGLNYGPQPGAVVTSRPGSTAVPAGSGDALAADLSNSANYRNQVFPMEKAIGSLERLGQTGTGPGTDELNNVKSFMTSMGFGKLLGIDVNKIKDFDEAKKYLTDWANRMSAGGTNDRLAATFASNPNTKMSNAAAVDVAKSVLSLRRMQEAQVGEFKATGLDPGQYTNWLRTWNKTQDVRAYGFDLMSPDAQRSLLKSLPATLQNGKPNPARIQFEESLRSAERNNLTNAAQ